MDAIILIGVLAAGILIGFLVRRKRAPADEERLRALSSDITKNIDKASMEAMMKAVNHLREQSRADLQHRQSSIESLVTPIRETLDKTGQQIRAIEKERKHDQGSLKERLEAVTRGQAQLQAETGRLANALKNPQARGRWGELTLRRTVELAGMVKHCDFEEQSWETDGEGRGIRPDMIVHLPKGRRVVVDAKTSLDAYLAAVETDDEAQRDELLKRHTRQLTEHVKTLASKAYWQQFENAPDFAVMFVPGEQFLSVALERDPVLQENALSKGVILAAPSTLVALLRVIAYGWREKSLAENARKIQELGADLHARIATFTGYLENVGNSLEKSVGAYNKAVGSLETRLLPGARKFTGLGIPEKKAMPEIKQVEAGISRLTTEREKP